MPRVTVGLITYNGAARVRASIESILGQTYADLELLIFDNGSTDGTTAICAEYAQSDSRVRHVRHPQTIPQSSNFRGVLMAAQTELFMWATDDDVRSPTFIESCVEELDTNPSAVAACTQAVFRDDFGREELARGTFTIAGSPTERLRKYFTNPRDSSRLFGVYRTQELKESYSVETSTFGYDWLVVGLTFKHGSHIEVPSVGLVRSANPPGKYFERYDRHFTREQGFVGRASAALPLLPLSLLLRQEIGAANWRAIRARIIRLNLQQSALLIRWKYPRTERLFQALKKVDKMAAILFK